VSGSGERSADLVTALGAIRARIAAACSAAGREPQEITLIAVTKTRPAADVAALARLGVLDFGESKDQEARAKIADLEAGPELPVELRWHLVGQLQTNKARSVASYAHAVHSVDRLKLVGALGAAAAAAQDRVAALEVFVQVSLDGDPARGGADPDDIARLADAVVERPALRLRGLMAVPPVGTAVAAAFGRLAQIAAAVRESHPGADAISAGMSGDFEVAIEHGATHVRVGTALLGDRPPLFH
jgi:pyridoxal phosphate enzyme (YggS family)